MKNILRSSWFTMTFMVVIVALSATTWTGCDERPQTGFSPIAAETHQLPTFDKSNRQVQAVMAVQERHTDRLMANVDVVGTGVGQDRDGAAVLLVLTKRAGVPNIPAIIEGVRTRIDVVGEVVAMGFTGRYRPVPGGVSVGNANECASGTIGCQVLKGGTRYALSNNHVLARENAAAIGERINQPGRYDAKPKCAQTEQIGTLADFKPIVFTTSANNEIDAAIAAYSSGVSTTCSMVNNLYTPSSTVVAPSVGLAVKKVGRTSSLTTGNIAGINVTINVGYSSGTARFVNQIYVASTMVRSGDSGSLMVTNNASANPVGLCFAGGSGTSFANPIGPVLSYFNATICSN